MNVLDCYVTEILSEPYRKGDWWYVDVMYDSWGCVSKRSISGSKEYVSKIEVGFHFIA